MKFICVHCYSFPLDRRDGANGEAITGEDLVICEPKPAGLPASDSDDRQHCAYCNREVIPGRHMEAWYRK